MKQYTHGKLVKNVAVKYCSEDNHYCIAIENQALEIMLAYRQKATHRLEAGGQLFAKYSENETIISYVTEPTSKDKRKRSLFIPHIPTWKKNTKKLYDKGFHYIGDWHTHPECNPHPSTNDITSIHSRFNVSVHELSRMVIIIVGMGDDDLYVGLSDGESIIELKSVDVL